MVDRSEDVEAGPQEKESDGVDGAKPCWACGQAITMSFEFCPHCGHAAVQVMEPSIEVLAADGTTRQVALVGDQVVIGKSGNCDVQLRDGRLSKEHARVFRYGEVYLLEDLGTDSGTYLKVSRPTILHHGDELLIGESRLRFVRR